MLFLPGVSVEISAGVGLRSNNKHERECEKNARSFKRILMVKVTGVKRRGETYACVIVGRTTT